MSRGWVIIKRIGRLLKFALICLVFTVCIFMLWRVFSTGIPKELKALTPNDALCELYEEKGDDLYMFKQKYDDITRSDAARGYFAVPSAVFIPDINQAQIVFRYNNSTITHLAEDYKLDSKPDREKDLFDVTLVCFVDLTPEDKTDNEDKVIDGKPNENIKEIRFQPTDVKSDRTALYSFYRYTFDMVTEDGTSFSELLESETLIAVHTQVYYNEDIDYEKTPYGALFIYDYRRENIDVGLKGRDKKALEA